jgi:hypothetical protein
VTLLKACTVCSLQELKVQSARAIAKETSSEKRVAVKEVAQGEELDVDVTHRRSMRQSIKASREVVKQRASTMETVSQKVTCCTWKCRW